MDTPGVVGDEDALVCPLVVVIGGDGTCFKVRVMPDDAVAYEVEVGHRAVVHQYALLYLATNPDFCAFCHVDTSAQIRVCADKAMRADDGGCFYCHAVSQGGGAVNGYSIVYFILFAQRWDKFLCQ